MYRHRYKSPDVVIQSFEWNHLFFPDPSARHMAKRCPGADAEPPAKRAKTQRKLSEKKQEQPERGDKASP